MQLYIRAIVVALSAGVWLAAPLPSQVGAAAAGARPLEVISGAKRWTVDSTQLGVLARHSIRIVQEAGDTAVIEGVLLWDVLQRFGLPSPEAAGRQRGSSYLRVVGGDSQVAVIALAELDPSFSRRIVLLADRRNGRPLDEAEGPWRVIIPEDQRHARWIRQVVRIELVHAGP